MHGLHSNSALFWAPEKAGVRQPFLILSPTLKHRGPPRRWGLCSHGAHLWAASAFAPCFEASGTPDGRFYVATEPTCGPLLILAPLLATREYAGVTYQFCPLLGPREGSAGAATSDFVSRFEASGTPQTARVMKPLGSLVGHFRLCPPL